MFCVNKQSLVFCGFLALLASQLAVAQLELDLDEGVVETVENVVTNVTSVVETPTTRALCNLKTVDLSIFFKLWSQE